MRIVLVGTVESTAVTLETLCEQNMPPSAVFGLDPALKERHGDYVDMAGMAARHGVPFIGVRSINDPDVVSEIASLEPDWLVVVGWSQICGEPLLAIPRLGSIGYHPTPLPAMRGRAVLAWTILLGCRSTAGTLFRLAPGVDSGDILVQRHFDLDERETLPSLISRHMAALKHMWQELAPRLKQENLAGQPQDESKASYCAKRGKEDGLIDWKMDSTMVDCLIRAVTRPYPGAFGWLRNARFTIWEAEPWNGTPYFGIPGQIVASLDEGLLVTCGANSTLLVREWAWEIGSTKPRIGDRIGSRQTEAPAQGSGG